MQSKELLLNEFRHRMKNTLATLQAIAGQTLKNCPKEERETYLARLQRVWARARRDGRQGVGPRVRAGSRRSEP